MGCCSRLWGLGVPGWPAPSLWLPWSGREVAFSLPELIPAGTGLSGLRSPWEASGNPCRRGHEGGLLSGLKVSSGSKGEVASWHGQRPRSPVVDVCPVLTVSPAGPHLLVHGDSGPLWTLSVGGRPGMTGAVHICPAHRPVRLQSTNISLKIQ